MASKYQQKIIKEYQDKGYIVIKLAKTNHNGIADLLIAKEGEQTLLIECKEKKDTVKLLQIVQNQKIASITGWKFIVMQDGIGELDLSKFRKQDFEEQPF
jgi:Holliday junction resolvase